MKKSRMIFGMLAVSASMFFTSCDTEDVAPETNAASGFTSEARMAFNEEGDTIFVDQEGKEIKGCKGPKGGPDFGKESGLTREQFEALSEEEKKALHEELQAKRQEHYDNASDEEKAKIDAMKAKFESMTEEERKAFHEKMKKGKPDFKSLTEEEKEAMKAEREAQMQERYNNASDEEKAKMDEMKAKIDAMTEEERQEFFKTHQPKGPKGPRGPKK